VQFLEEGPPTTNDDLPALRYAVSRGMVVTTCNGRELLRLAETESYVGIIILLRRPTRVTECAALLRLIGRASQSGSPTTTSASLRA